MMEHSGSPLKIQAIIYAMDQNALSAKENIRRLGMPTDVADIKRRVQLLFRRRRLLLLLLPPLQLAHQESWTKLEKKRDLLKKQINDLKKMLSKSKKGDEIKLYPSEVPKDKEKRDKISHLFKRNPSEEQIRKRKKVFQSRLSNLEMDMKNKDDNKTVALGTSKINYMDPRISVAWCKREECDISKVFAKALRDKFPWAMSAPMNYDF